MAVQELTQHSVRAQSWSPVVDEVITRTVEQHGGIKETELTMSVLVELAENRIEADPQTILTSIHRMIRSGRLVGVDCEIGEIGYTFVLPAKSHVAIIMPVYVEYNGTRH